MTVDSATMTGFLYVGNVDVPAAGGGTVTMMKFTADSMNLSGVTTEITENGLTAKETDTGFTASGVTMYATQLSGTLPILGPQTFTPGNAALLWATDLITAVGITLTGVTLDQGIIHAGQSQRTGLVAVG